MNQPLQNNKHYPSTPRVRLHRLRKKLKSQFHELIFKIDQTEKLFTIEEQLEQLLIEAEAYKL